MAGLKHFWKMLVYEKVDFPKAMMKTYIKYICWRVLLIILQKDYAIHLVFSEILIKMIKVNRKV